MEGDFIKTNDKFLPLSWLYGIGVGFRNILFEIGILKSKSYSVPVISVGNITVGGTGKTPHVEYLIRLLKDKCNLAVLSRGYMRKSRGFLIADKDTPMQAIGDEPYQMKMKFPDIVVAVDKKRTRGIENLTSGDYTGPIDAILLDDAFQHRYVKPGINILLVDYHRLIIYDQLLPAGRLREPVRAKNRADIVIVTKCPKDLKPMEFRVITKAMKLYPYQQLFFSTHDYEPLRPAFPEPKQERYKDIKALSGKNILLLTGIASPQQMQIDLQSYAGQIVPLAFDDHHNFKKKDVRLINETFSSMPSPKLIITTEKDETRLLQAVGLSDEVKRCMHVLPLKISIMLDQEEAFNSFISGYVWKNARTSILARKKMEARLRGSMKSASATKPNNDGDRPAGTPKPGSKEADQRPATISFK